MFKHYLASMLRNLKRDTLYSLINICGLSLGIGCCLLLGLFISHEAGFDRHHENQRNIYRLVNELVINGRGGGLKLAYHLSGRTLRFEEHGIIEA